MAYGLGHMPWSIALGYVEYHDPIEAVVLLGSGIHERPLMRGRLRQLVTLNPPVGKQEPMASAADFCH